MDHEYSCFYLLLKLLYHIMFLYFNNMHGKLLFIQNYILMHQLMKLKVDM